MGKWSPEAKRLNAIRSMEETSTARPTDEMLRAAWARNSAPRSLTAWVCGDPAPGQSALDKRNL